ncbi:hypothetical protein UACE39S_06779 [Ureibacillus acetophenoni]
MLKKQLIMEAAIELFSKKGIDATSSTTNNRTLWHF